ncbi:hypothetical protein HYW19_03945 [Candidatus Woesearchaeota archaeon]|nr:hypothetical protein [Candidatus Woesearchaeota archaeon]
MKNFINVIKEIDRTLNMVFIFSSILNAAIFFLSVYLLLSIVNLYPILALIPAAIYFALRLYSRSKMDKRKIVESKYEPLKEKLRTAADNIKEDNPVVNELEEEVVHDLKNVGLSSFIQTKEISYKLFATIALSFVIVLITTMNLYIIDLNEFLSTTVPGYLKGIPKLANSAMLGEINESDDIYGNSQLAVLGNEQIDIKISPVNYEVSVREEGDVKQKQFNEIFPSDVDVEQASTFEENIPEEQQELVKKYFDKLAGR